jgi:A/G-specific adenine glycosylase
VTPLHAWYVRAGRHDLPWRTTRDRWSVLVSEVMLTQTQVSRVLAAWPAFIGQFPDPGAMADASLADVVIAWGRLGYPRRARDLWRSAQILREQGWPDDLRSLPGVGAYIAGAVRAQADDERDAIGLDVNIRRVVERHAGARLTPSRADATALELAAPMAGRDRLLALMDLGALVCTKRAPRCDQCPLYSTCATRGRRPDERATRSPTYAGSMRQRRGDLLARLRAESHVAIAQLDAEALATLVADGLVFSDGTAASLAPR